MVLSPDCLLPVRRNLRFLPAFVLLRARLAYALLLALSPIALAAQTAVFQPSPTQGEIVDFGSVAPGTQARQTLTFQIVTNPGGQPLGTPAVLTSGSPNLEFTDANSGTCTTTSASASALEVGATCTVDVLFQPKLPGVRAGAVNLSNGTGEIIATAYLIGSGAAPELAIYTSTNFSLHPGPEASVSTNLLGVDGAGNVYGVTSQQAVIRSTPAGSGYTETTVFPGRSTLLVFGMDAAGNFYGREGASLYKEAPSAGGYREVLVTDALPAYTDAVPAIASTFTVTPVGDIFYLVETTVDNSAISYYHFSHITHSGGSYSTASLLPIPHGHSQSLVGVRSDAHNSLYLNISGFSGGFIYKFSPSGVNQGSVVNNFVKSFAVSPGGDVSYSLSGVPGLYRDGTRLDPDNVSPYGPGFDPVLVGAQGDLYGSTGNAAGFSKLDLSTPVLLFPSLPVGVPYALSSRTAVLVNTGTTPLTITSGLPPALPEGYLLDPNAPNGCPTSAGPDVLTPGASCNLTLDFKPILPRDSGTQTLTFVDDALNLPGAQQTLLLSGTATGTPLTITPASLPSAVAGKPYAASFSANGGVGPYTFTAPSLPAALNLSTSGVLSGTPATPGVYPLMISASDPAGFTGTLPVSLLVDAPRTTVLLTPAILLPATQGSSYEQRFTAQGGLAPYTFSVSAGALPAGLALSSTGTLSGTSAVTGSYNFTIHVADSTAGTPQQSDTNYQLRVTAAGAPSGPPTIDASAGFSSALGLHLNGSANFVDSTLQLTSGRLFEATSAWSSTPVDIRHFTTDFRFQVNPGAQADGFTFALQNSGPNALGYLGGDLGYGGIPSSIAVKFDLFNNAGEQSNSVGFYSNGNMPTFPSSVLANQLDLSSGHIFAAHLSYDGISLTLTVVDTSTNLSSTYSQVMNLPATIGSSTAYAGFTAGTGALTSTTRILNWTYTVLP